LEKLKDKSNLTRNCFIGYCILKRMILLEKFNSLKRLFFAERAIRRAIHPKNEFFISKGRQERTLKWGKSLCQGRDTLSDVYREKLEASNPHHVDVFGNPPKKSQFFPLLQAPEEETFSDGLKSAEALTPGTIAHARCPFESDLSFAPIYDEKGFREREILPERLAYPLQRGARFPGGQTGGLHFSVSDVAEEVVGSWPLREGKREATK
jgi:hypothetical protein